MTPIQATSRRKERGRVTARGRGLIQRILINRRIGARAAPEECSAALDPGTDILTDRARFGLSGRLVQALCSWINDIDENL
jgi:hypothetical protein